MNSLQIMSEVSLYYGNEAQEKPLNGCDCVEQQLDSFNNSKYSFGKRKKNSKKLQGQYICEGCGTNKTPQWRPGPNGKNTLCNACGVRWKKQKTEKSFVKSSRGRGRPRKIYDIKPPIEPNLSSIEEKKLLIQSNNLPITIKNKKQEEDEVILSILKMGENENSSISKENNCLQNIIELKNSIIKYIQTLKENIKLQQITPEFISNLQNTTVLILEKMQKDCLYKLQKMEDCIKHSCLIQSPLSSI